MRLKRLALLSIVLCCTVSVVLGQVATSILSVNVTANRSYRTLSNKKGDEITQRIIDLSNDIYTPIGSMSCEALLCQRISDRLWVSTGVGLANFGFKTKVFLDDTDPRRGSVPDTQDVEGGWIWYKSKSKLRYLTIPLVIGYKGQTDKLYRFVCNAGVDYGYMFKTKVTTVLKYGVLDYQRDSREWLNKSNEIRHNVIMRTALGYEFLLGQGIALTAQIQARYGFRNTQDTPIHLNVYNAGLQLGINKVLQ